MIKYTDSQIEKWIEDVFVSRSKNSRGKNALMEQRSREGSASLPLAFLLPSSASLLYKKQRKTLQFLKIYSFGGCTQQLKSIF